MIALLITILFGLGFAYFATVNTDRVTINFAQYSIPGLPIYIVILGSLLVGITLATIIHAVDSISNHLILRKKENTIKELKKTTAELIKRVHQLELSNQEQEEKKEETNIL